MKNRLANKWALITGATSGIGKAIAEQFAELEVNLILTGRRKDRLERLANELKSKHQIEIQCLSFDVRSFDSCKEAMEQNSVDVDILVNNAGLALGMSPIDEGDIEQWEQMIDTNVKGLLYMSRLIIPKMRARNSGHVINIGSIAGHDAYANGAVYCGTKYAVKAINEATKKDLHGTNVRVSLVAPGMVDTEFSTVRFSGDKAKADDVYKGLTPLYAEDIAEIVIFIANRPDHVNILNTLVLPTAQSASTLVSRN